MVLFAIVNVTVFLKLWGLAPWTDVSDHHGVLLTSAGWGSLNEPWRKRCQMRQKARLGVSYSHLNKHRLINSLEGWIDETGLSHRNTRTGLPPKISPKLPESAYRRLDPGRRCPGAIHGEAVTVQVIAAWEGQGRLFKVHDTHALFAGTFRGRLVVETKPNILGRCHPGLSGAARGASRRGDAQRGRPLPHHHTVPARPCTLRGSARVTYPTGCQGTFTARDCAS